MAADRIQSIDVLRALTMVLMIWVNDFWSLTDIPNWLQHMPADVDALGFSDVIFPAFLFIVGLAIPYAADARRKQGGSQLNILGHIGVRSFALVVMGFYMVNLESYHPEAAGMSKALWQVLMIVGFVLIWNRYRPDRVSVTKQRLLKLVGVMILLVLAATFRSDPANGYHWMEPHWWGILGMIGWSYLLCAVAQLYFGRSVMAMVGFWLFFSLFNIAAFAGWLDFLEPVRRYVWIIGDASLPAMTMAGCVTSTLYRRWFSNGRSSQFILLLAVLGGLTLLAGFGLRPYWGISKILATPAWTQICTGIGFLSFAVFYWLADVKDLKMWPDILLPAGVATLTCYLVPYVAYPIMELIPFSLPGALTTGLAGLSKSMIFAVAVVIITGWLNRAGIRLKI